MINSTKKRFKLIISVFFVVIFIVTSYIICRNKILPENTAKVTYVDVGQGDCSLIEYNGCNYLIDCGESSCGKTVLNYLKDKNIDNLDGIIISHPHSDHMGSIEYLINNLNADQIYMSEYCFDTLFSSYFSDSKYDRIKKKSIIVSNNDIIKINSSVFRFYVNDITEDDNDSSLVTIFEYKDTSFIFTGDISEEEERLIKIPDNKVSVIKVAHHGSISSTCKDFIKNVNPEYAIISCGKHNNYGHPHSEVENMLIAEKIKVLRTDKEGNITITTDGNRVFRTGK